MKSINVLSLSLLLLAACGGNTDEIEAKKQQLADYKKEASDLNQKINSLEQEIAAMDPSFVQQSRKTTLVTTVPVQNKTFRHFVEVRGSVASRKNVTLSTEVPGRIQGVQVKEGIARSFYGACIEKTPKLTIPEKEADTRYMMLTENQFLRIPVKLKVQANQLG